MLSWKSKNCPFTNLITCSHVVTTPLFIRRSTLFINTLTLRVHHVEEDRTREDLPTADSPSSTSLNWKILLFISLLSPNKSWDQRMQFQHNSAITITNACSSATTCATRSLCVFNHNNTGTRNLIASSTVQRPSPESSV